MEIRGGTLGLKVDSGLSQRHTSGFDSKSQEHLGIADVQGVEIVHQRKHPDDAQ